MELTKNKREQLFTFNGQKLPQTHVLIAGNKMCDFNCY